MPNRLAPQNTHAQVDTAVAPTSPSTGSAGASAITASGTSQVLAPANGSRAQLVVCNTDGTNAVFLGYGTTAVANTGIRIPAGGTWVETAWLGSVTIIAGAGTPVVSFVEL